jgi:hypothetical protein
MFRVFHYQEGEGIGSGIGGMNMKMRMPPLATIGVGAPADGGEELIELAPGEASLHFLQRVYRSVRQPMSRRLRAAIEALPFEQPKLSAIAIGSMNDNNFAMRLDRAIERSGSRVLLAPPELELTAEPAPMRGPGGASSIKRRSIR